MQDATEQLCFPNPSFFPPRQRFLEPRPGDKCHHPAGTSHQTPRGAALTPRQQAGSRAPVRRHERWVWRLGGVAGKLWGSPALPGGGWQPRGQSRAIALGRGRCCQSIFSA